MATATKAKQKTKTSVRGDEAVIRAADEYMASKKAEKEAKAAKDSAKGTLLEWLGPDVSRKLSDGRTVQRVTTEYPAATIERAPYSSTNIYIS